LGDEAHGGGGEAEVTWTPAPDDAARLSAPLDHLQEPCRSKTWMLLERGADEVLVRIEQGDRGSKGDIGEALGLDGEGHRVAMNPELGGDDDRPA
jgi:hypothetical protein